MTGRWQALTAEAVDRLTVRVLRRAWRARPEVRIIRVEGEDAVVKDYGRSGNLFKRGLLGAFLAGREAAALRRVEGIDNVPRLYSRPQPWAIVVEHLEARSVTSVDDAGAVVDEQFCARLTAMIEELHARGLAHSDLEQLDNILVAEDGRPALVDFAAAIMSGANPLAALALPYVRRNDLRAVAKLKARLAPDLLTDSDRRELDAREPVEVWFRRVRRYIRGPVKSLAATGEEPGGGQRD